MSAVVIPRSETFLLTASGTGRSYRIFIAWPEEPPPPEGFPVIYQLDANASFASTVESLRMRCHRPDATGVVPAVVVGIGYPEAGTYDRTRRGFDYTPPREPGDDRTGGADAFLGFIENELKPRIADMHPVDRAREILCAHSLGGYFALRVLLRRTDAFRACIAISPSIWWDRDGLLAGIAHLESVADLNRRVMIAVGEYEQGLAPWQADAANRDETLRRRQSRRMVDHARDFACRLREFEPRGLCVRFEELPGEDHASAVPVAISHGLRFVLSR